jgi:tetratricopeptide (TPR) repeat protein
MTLTMDEVELYRQIMSRDPSSQAFVYLAEALWERKMYEEAIETCTNGLRLHPHDLRARVVLGLSYLGTGELDRAETVLLKAKEMLEINTITYQALAELYDQKGNTEQAGRYRQLFKAIHPTDVAQVESGPAEPEIETSPEEAEQEEEEVATITMAEVYVEQGHLDKAMEVYRRILQNSPETEEIADRLAELDKQVGKTEVARTLLSILESCQSELHERAASDTTSPSTEPSGIDLEKLAALVQKYMKGAQPS